MSWALKVGKVALVCGAGGFIGGHLVANLVASWIGRRFSYSGAVNW